MSRLALCLLLLSAGCGTAPTTAGTPSPDRADIPDTAGRGDGGAIGDILRDAPGDVLAQAPDPTPAGPARTLHTTVDLMVGEEQQVSLADGSKATLKLLAIDETREPYSSALRIARAEIEVGGTQTWLGCGTYNLPVTIAGVQIDCAVTKDYYTNTGTDAWKLVKDARLRVWPPGWKWIQPDSFVYPVAKQLWFSADTWIANEPVVVAPSRGARIYYHYGLDLGGAEGMDILSATDGAVVAAETGILPGHDPKLLDCRTAPAVSCPLTVLDAARGWYLQYYHVKDVVVRLGDQVKAGQRMALLGKRDGSGGWSHLHFQILRLQPSGQYAQEDAYPFVWTAYMKQHAPALVAVAGPLHHEAVGIGMAVTFDASKSVSTGGEITSYEWTFSDSPAGTAPVAGPKAQRKFSAIGTYTVILEVKDRSGNVAYDFVHVYTFDAATPDIIAPRVNANYVPTVGIAPGDTITFKVRTFNTTMGQEIWDFGDGTATATTMSNTRPDEEDAPEPFGYSLTTHSYAQPGHYLVRVERTAAGLTGVTTMHVAVGAGFK